MASASMPGYELQSGFDFNGWLRIQWLGFNAWLRAAKWLRLQWLALATMAWLRCLATSCKRAQASMAGCGYNGLASMPCYELQNGLGLDGWLRATKWLRLQWLASASMPGYELETGFGFNGLTSMPDYELQKGFDFNGWLRLQWLGLNAWLRAAKWLRLQ
jgi:hypothetical protein